jgi:hypothetical protein
MGSDNKIYLSAEKLKEEDLKSLTEELITLVKKKNCVLNGTIRCSTSDDGFDTVLLVIKDNIFTMIGVPVRGEILGDSSCYDYILDTEYTNDLTDLVKHKLRKL